MAYLSQNKMIIAGVGVLALTLLAVFVVKSSDTPTRDTNESQITYVHNSIAEMTKDELMKESDVVVVGQVKNIESVKVPSEFRKGKSDIFRNVTVAVEEYLVSPKNNASAEITVQVLGGKVGNEEMIVADANPYTIGQRVLFFLKKKGHHFVLAADPHGRYMIQDGNVAHGMEEGALLKMTFGAETLPLDAVKEKVRTAAKSK